MAEPLAVLRGTLDVLVLKALTPQLLAAARNAGCHSQRADSESRNRRRPDRGDGGLTTGDGG